METWRIWSLANVKQHWNDICMKVAGWGISVIAGIVGRAIVQEYPGKTVILTVPSHSKCVGGEVLLTALLVLQATAS